MNRINPYLLPALLLALLNCHCALPREAGREEDPPQTPAAEMNGRLGKGMNIGNTFEAMPSWQSPFDPQDMKRIAGLGFSHVRIPIRWERDDRSMASAPYTIYPEFMDTIRRVVDEALKSGLHIIINMHHHDGLYADPAGQRERFLSQWEQISDCFRDYPDSLLFEIMNEPHDNLTADLWNGYAKEALSTIRKSNPGRCVLLGVAEWGGVDALQSLEIPDDPHLILTIHYYNPFHFTHQAAEWVEGSDAWLGTVWNDSEVEHEAVREDFRPAKRIARTGNIPVHIGEFGAFSRADMESRIRWTRFLARWFEEQGFSWAYWEWNSTFGIFDPKTDSFRTGLTEALLGNPL
ncbi:MAG: glycoside hydrolase family 5 protein [Proteiniphilum sp.]|jgi:endoglucanase|nr:glycoside hydrolase family 5 protein [Proteiniphilum sp.]